MLSTADARVVRRDPELPGLGLLLDEEALSQRLFCEVPQVGGHRLRCSYLRYKPGTNCLAAYRLEAADGPAAQGAPTHFYAKAFRSPADSKLRKGAIDGSPVPDLLPGPVILADVAVSIRSYPDDDRLPALRTLASSNRSSLLRKLVPDVPAVWGATAHVLRYKPERRCVLRLDGPEAMKVSVRCYAPREFSASDSFGFSSTGSLRIPRRLGRSRRHKLLVYEWIAGRALDELSSRGSAIPMRDIGAALAELHLQDVHRLPMKMPGQKIHELQAAAATIVFLCPHLADRCALLVRKLADLLRDTPLIVHPLHGDFSADQVLVSDDSIVILDLDEAVLGDPAADLGSFLADLDRQAILGTLLPHDVDVQAEEFVKGHRDTLPIRTERVELYRAAALLRVAPLPFRSRLPDWPEVTEAILTRAENVLLSIGPKKQRPQRTEPGSWQHTPASRPASIDTDRIVVDPSGVLDDPKLRFLASAFDARHAAGRFRQSLVNVSGLDSLALRAIRVVRHKPGRRCLIEYDFGQSPHGERTTELTLIGKVRAKRPDFLTYRVQQMLFTSSLDSDADNTVAVPESLCVIPEWHMWLQRKVEGRTATQLLETEDQVRLAVRIAEAIHKLHDCRAPLRRRHTLNDELEILHERLPKVIRERPDWQEPIRRILDACDRISEHLPQHATALIHRDFYPDQVLSDGNTITLLDLDLCCLGDPALDVGNFHAHLTEQALRRSGCADGMSAVQEALVDRYTQLGGDEFRPRIEVYSVLSLVRHIYLSTLWPERRHLTEPLIELSAQQLGVRLKNGSAVTSSLCETTLS